MSLQQRKPDLQLVEKSKGTPGSLNNCGFSTEEKLNHINKSPNAVAAHDKQAWLNIFADRAMVEDPVGSKPHFNNPRDPNNPVSLFYDTFIAPNEIVFHVDNDYVSNMNVVRDLSVVTRMNGVEVVVPMHLLYELTVQKGELKINRLAAHWELLPMVSVLFKNGLSAFPVMFSLSARMMKNQGVGGAIGFMSGVGKLRGKGKKLAEQFIQALNDKNEAAIAKITVEKPEISTPNAESYLTVKELMEAMPGKLSFSKMIVAGHSVSCSVKLYDGKVEVSGVAIFNFDSSSKKIKQLQLYY